MSQFDIVKSALNADSRLFCLLLSETVISLFPKLDMISQRSTINNRVSETLAKKTYQLKLKQERRLITVGHLRLS